MTGSSSSPAPSLPIVRLKPKADASRIRRGQPWVYADDVVTDRRTKAIAAGSLAILQDAGRTDIALVAVNGASKLMLRVLSRDLEAHALLQAGPCRGRRAARRGHRPFWRYLRDPAERGLGRDTV